MRSVIGCLIENVTGLAAVFNPKCWTTVEVIGLRLRYFCGN